MSRENPEDNFKRFPLMMPPSLLDKVDDYRRDVGTLPGKGEAMRDLIELGLKTYWESKSKGE